jgi:hypothetical protein
VTNRKSTKNGRNQQQKKKRMGNERKEVERGVHEEHGQRVEVHTNDRENPKSGRNPTPAGEREEKTGTTIILFYFFD